MTNIQEINNTPESFSPYGEQEPNHFLSFEKTANDIIQSHYSSFKPEELRNWISSVEAMKHRIMKGNDTNEIQQCQDSINEINSLQPDELFSLIQNQMRNLVDRLDSINPEKLDILALELKILAHSEC